LGRSWPLRRLFYSWAFKVGVIRHFSFKEMDAGPTTKMRGSRSTVVSEFWDEGIESWLSVFVAGQYLLSSDEGDTGP
jgi:hypothetical protein